MVEYKVYLKSIKTEAIFTNAKLTDEWNINFL